ncbi:hypothetical protein [Gryllotalpicola protaetiae]|uniref:Uncharacterized protein n=1 Tax=Gryllotalpicola protaetiae TaxID=2419771 RepID=A0A387BN15_9MICO|nr:hypothetical protein [Gryllotalpicola protaetiae]AYG02396.1 hypothetical protein D7I44_01825 [Gryllotalpicola protaetiae]
MPHHDAKSEAARPGSFAAFLASTRPGTDRELHEELTKLVAAVEDTGKAGTLTLTVVLKPLDGAGTALMVNDEIKAKRPTRTRDASIAYVDTDHTLSRRDPSAMPLFEDEDIRDLPPANPITGEIKEIDK